MRGNCARTERSISRSNLSTRRGRAEIDNALLQFFNLLYDATGYEPPNGGSSTFPRGRHRASSCGPIGTPEPQLANHHTGASLSRPFWVLLHGCHSGMCRPHRMVPGELLCQLCAMEKIVRHDNARHEPL
jgi:hypothetical protein